MMSRQLGKQAVSLALACLCLLFCWAGQASAATLKIGLISLGGYAYRDEEGVIRGFDPEFALNMANAAQMQADYYLYEDVPRALQDLQDGNIDVLMDFARTPERQQRFLFTEYPLEAQSNSIFVRREDERYLYGEPAQLNGMKIAYSKGTAARENLLSYCTSNKLQPQLQEYKDNKATLAALMAGQVDAVVWGGAPAAQCRAVLYFRPENSYVMLRKDNLQLKTRLDAALGRLLQDEPFLAQRLNDKYMHGSEGRQLNFSSREREFVRSHPSLKVAVIKKDKPFFYERSGKPEGILPEYFAVLSRLTGMQFTFVTYASHSDVATAVKTGEADVAGIYGGDPLTADSEGLLHTSAYVLMPAMQITRAGFTGPVQKVGVARRRLNMIGIQLAGSRPELQLVPYANNEESYQALAAGQVDAIYSSLAVAAWQLNEHGSSKLNVTAIPGMNLNFNGAVAKENYLLCNILNKALRLAEPDMQRLITNYSNQSGGFWQLVERAPATYIVFWGALMLALILGLAYTMFKLNRQHREKVEVMAQAAATETEKIRLAALEKTAEEKNQFLANISHDMRTPLNAVIGFANLARDPAVTVNTKDLYLHKIQESGQLMLELINDTLLLSKINSGKLQLKLEPLQTDTVAIFGPVFEVIRSQAAAKQITFSVDTSAELHRSVLADQLNLQKIILNLLTNAVKYTPAGGHVRIRFANTTGADGGIDTIIEVSDDGIGMKPAFQKHAFEAFSQENRTGYETAGTGLGLAIVKQLVDLMGGTITLASVPEQGTTFTIRLRLEPAQLQGDQTAAPAVLDDSHLAGCRVLLCEDNVLNREIACALLKARGMRVDMAADGGEGVAKFTASAPGTYAAVLMDIRMPVLDGYDTAKAIRALNRSDAGSIPIIAMSANAFAEDISAAKAAGMNEYVTKPVNPQQLYRVLAQLVPK